MGESKFIERDGGSRVRVDLRESDLGTDCVEEKCEEKRE